LRLARLGAQVEAIDPNPSLIHQARLKLPKQLVSQIKYEVGSAEALQHSAANFDLVVFSWSLC
jgi:ubiquinone/menaquinone biosynthesis C-methylase UbiE